MTSQAFLTPVRKNRGILVSELATEQLNQCHGFDRFYYEGQRRRYIAPALGQVALRLHETRGMETRFRHELIDGIAEAIPGIVNNERVYNTINGRIVAADGEHVEGILVNGLRERIKQANHNPILQSFGPQRARHELDETREWQKMVDGAVEHNTILALSPYSEEYCAEQTIPTLEIAGQDPKSKRAMLRIAHWDGAKLHVLSRSIDNSSLELLKKAARSSLGYEFQASNSTEMLGERLKYELTWQEALDLTDKFIETADQIIAETQGGQWRQGRPLEEAVDVQRFVESETQIIENLLQTSRNLASQNHTYESYRAAWEDHLYKKTALIKERMEYGVTDDLVDIERAADTAGALAEARGESYNMCGMIITVKSESQSKDLGFESTKNLIGKKVQCPECKEKVVPDSSKLLGGRLCCGNCKYEVDVCTGKVYSKPQAKNKMPDPKEPDIFEAISAELARYELERKQKELAEKQQKARKAA